MKSLVCLTLVTLRLWHTAARCYACAVYHIKATLEGMTGGSAQVFEVVSKLVVATKSATTEEETKRQRLGKQLEALLQKVHHLSSSHSMPADQCGIIACRRQTLINLD